MNGTQWRVAALLFSSGACALIYQTAWMRQFRLIFGASTFATAAVLAIFMGGLGIGSALLGKRADRHPNPLLLYARLELAIALAAAISPLLLWLVARIYWSLGGSPQLGLAGASIVRLLLSLLVLGIPTFLMGGTLPAAARAIQNDDDSGRRGVALLYGLNTLGAVAGTLLSTFVLLETFGNRQTLFLAVGVNLIVALVAMKMTLAPPVEKRTTSEDEPVQPRRVPAKAVYAASALVGFSFLLMELVWYRMLSPLLGGTTYMFGLILAVALFGIGLGGAAYALLRRNAPATAAGFAVTCAAEALAIAIPFALGDRIALLTLALSDFTILGLGASVVAWSIITFIVVFPAAFVSGVQFPLLVALLGQGRGDVGREVGATYAWNTVGAIAGSLAGGFGLMPLLSATGCWQLVVALLALLASGALVLAWREPQRGLITASAVTAAFALLCLIATGPTAVWRHSGIGAGRAVKLTAQNSVIDWMRWNERTKVWDADGRESGVALSLANQYAFIVNGKSDGSARGDAGTQVMCGLVGAAFHPRPERALVVGLGTGSSAGWLAAIPTMKRVDVVELEPVVLDVARAMSDFNHGAMKNPKLDITIADAREVLLTTPYRYDIVASEPSNPFRAGIASLFTREFYLAVEARLTPRGVFAQWVQTYDVDPETLRTVYATLTSVFPHVQTWHTSPGDLLLVASNAPLQADVESLRARMATEPFRSALRNAWRTAGVEGFLSRFVANEEFARRAAAEALSMNTDDRTVIEFGFARSIGGSRENLLPLIQTNAAKLGLSRPMSLRGHVGRGAIEGEMLAATGLERARNGDEQAAHVAASMQRFLPTEAAAIVARLRLEQHRYAESATLVRRALLAYRTDPWLDTAVMTDAIAVAQRLSIVEPQLAPAMYELVSQPYAGQMLDNDRRIARAVIAGRAPRCGKLQIAALEDLEPNTPYRADVLRLRVRCYGETRHPLAERARQELRDFAAKDVEELVSPPPQ